MVRPGQETYFGSLTEFSHLEELRLPFRTMLGFTAYENPTVNLQDILPLSLEFLFIGNVLHEDWEVLHVQIRRLLDVLAGRFPAWKKLGLQVIGCKFSGEESESDLALDGKLAAPVAEEVYGILVADCKYEGIEVVFDD